MTTLRGLQGQGDSHTRVFPIAYQFNFALRVLRLVCVCQDLATGTMPFESYAPTESAI